MIRLFLLIALTMSCLFGNAQVLKTTSLNLNAGGVINDIVFIPQMNAYAVVGNFTTIGVATRKNLAFIDATTLAVLPQAPITTMNGEVRSVEYYHIPTVTVGNMVTPATHFLFLGGNFTSVNGAQREYLITLQYTELLTPLTSTSSLTNANIVIWNYMMNHNDPTYISGRFFGVNDLVLAHDTLLVAGNFDGVNTTTTAIGGYVDSYKFAGFKVNRSALSRLNLVYTNTTIPNNYAGMGIGVSDQHYYVGFAELITNQITDVYRVARSLATAPQLIDIGVNASPQNDKWYSSMKTWSSNRMGTISNSRNLLLFRTSGTLNSYGQEGYELSGIDPSAVGSLTSTIGYDFYNDDLLLFREKATASYFQRYKQNTNNGTTINFSTVGSQINLLPATSGSDFPSADSSNRVMVKNNLLFLSSRELTSVSSSPRSGLAVFCLEPENPKPFINPDTTICFGNIRTYSIPKTAYASGYKWSYSGTGVYYTSPTQSVPTLLNGSVFFSDTSCYTITLHFQQSITAGTLTCEPFSVCNTTTDYQFSKPRSINLTLVVSNDISPLVDSLAFTCIVDTLNLVAQSPTVGATFQWFYPNLLTQVNSNDSLTINGTGIFPSVIYPTGYYYTQVTNPVTGCKSADSIWVSQNTTPPTIAQDSLVITPPEFTCVNTQQVLSASSVGSSIYWTTTADTTVQFSNPHTIYSISPTSYFAFAVSNSNGCKAKQIYNVQANYDPVNGILSNYSNFPTLVTDTINCMTTALTINCAVDPNDINASNGTAYWVLNNTPVLSLTTADSVGMDAQFHTKTYEFVTENALNGCQFTYNVTVLFDLETPFVATYMGNHSINCSVDTLTMVHLETGGYVTGSWLDGGGNSTGSSTVFVNGTGTFIYEVTDTINGCVNTDTVNVIQTPELFLAGTSDTVVCVGDEFPVTVSAINVSETVSYNWSTGSTSDFSLATGGTDSVLTVIATTSSGCIGYDTIHVDITAPILASFTGFMGCGATNGSIQVTNVSGGAGTYTYSIDGGSFSTDLLFDSLTVGEHPILIQDALGCVYSFTDTLDASAGSPEMSFLITTYSQTGDTLAVVNNTLYQGFDSTAWVFPLGTLVIFTSDSLALIQLPDTSTALITLIGFQDTCSYTFSKTIYIDSIMPEYPTTYSAVKIQSITVYPNPTTGAFTLDIVFGTAQNYGVFITTDLGQPVVGMNQSGYGTTVSLPFTFPNGTPPATYHVHVVSDFDARQLTLILN